MGRIWWLAFYASIACLDSAVSTLAYGQDTRGESRLIAVPVTSRSAVSGGKLESARLEAYLDGIPQAIARVRTPSAVGEQVTHQDGWQVLIYVEAPSSTADGLRKAALYLSREAEMLTRLGSTEIVLADPHPRVLLEASSNPLAIKEVLRDMRAEALTTGELQWHRQRFEDSESVDATGNRATTAFEDEVALLEQQRLGLMRSLATRASQQPKLLILISNGFDLNPRAFYHQRVAQSFIEDPRSEWTHSELARAIAVDGWTTLAFALGPRPEEFDDPFAPLFELTRATGGEVVTRHGEITDVLQRASRWPIVQVRLADQGENGPEPFEIVRGSDRRKLRTTQWASAEIGSAVADLAADRLGLSGASVYDERRPIPVLKMLRPEGLTLQGQVKIRTVAGHKRIHRVTFLLDEEIVDETEKTPFSTVIDLGATVRPCTITAIAYSRSGRAIGRDSLDLNMALTPPRVRIRQMDHDPQTGLLEIVATATSPNGSSPELVQFLMNDVIIASFSEPPYRTRIGVMSLEPVDIVAVVARYPDGQVAEAASLPAAVGPSDELDVNLVELLAMITPRGRRSKVDLERSDFVIRQQGRVQPIDQFSRWEEIPLTLGLMLDTSDSMNEILEDVREAGVRFFHDALGNGDEAFVIDFNNRPRLIRQTTADSEQLLDSLENLRARGMTALYDAIVFSLQQFRDSSGRRALVVVTDGEDSASYYQPRDCVRQARMHGVPIYLIVLGLPPDPHREPHLLRNYMIARRTGGEVYYISDLDDLSLIYEQVADELRRQYFLGFNSGHTLTPEELEEIEIEVIRKGISVRTLLASQQRGS